MKFVAPITVDDTNLTTDVANVEADWSAGTYNLGDRAVEGEYVYEVIADPSTTDQPSVGVTHPTPTWLLLGHANKWRMWREGVDSPSESTGDINTSIPVPTAISTVGVLSVVGQDVNVRLIDSAIMNIEAPTVEEITGTKDGSNTAFTISSAGQFVAVFLNGVFQVEGVDYTRVTTAITATGSIPGTGAQYIALIFESDEPAIEDVAGTKDGTNTSFTITESGGEALLFLNGIYQVEGTDYTRTGTAIAITGGTIPDSGDTFKAVIFTGNLPTIEDVDGTKDGENEIFMISTAGEAALFLKGVYQVEGVDYDRDGTDITITGGTLPESGDEFIAVIWPDILFPGGVIYDVTKTVADIGVGDWWSYFFTDYEIAGTLIFDDIPPYFGASVTLEVDVIAANPADATEVGRVVIGKAIDAGTSLMDVRSRNLTYTQKTRDEFGNLTLVERRTIRVVDFPVKIPAGNTDYVQRQAAALSATPTLFIADPNKPETIVFGVFESFDIIINGFLTDCSIGVEEY